MTEVALRGEVLPPQESLENLISRANSEHQLVEEMLGRTMEHVIKAGEALSEVRRVYADQFKGWEAWVEENFDGGRVVASQYMRIFEYRDLIDGLPNVRQAMKRLKGMPALRKPGYRGYSDELREEARVLHANDMSYAEIGRILGVSAGTIKNWVDPEALQRHQARVRAEGKKRREEARQKREETARRAAEREARRVGGALAEAYSLAHKLEAPLARALREATDPEVKKELTEAVYESNKARYAIIRVLGIS